MDLVSDLVVESIILRQPVKVRDNDIYLSELWYQTTDGRIIRPIFQTPRLRIMYKAQRFQDGLYSYCVSLHGRDIDPNIEKFFNMVQNIDKQIITQFKQKSSEWILPNIKKTYTSALVRKSDNHEFYLKLKLLEDRDSNILTSIMNSDRTPAKCDDIVYGRYADQYIAPAFVCYHDEGIQPIWQTHQIVISDCERVFLSRCLLDTIAPPVALVLPALPYLPSMQSMQSMPPPPPLPMNLQTLSSQANQDYEVFDVKIPRPPPKLNGPIRHFVKPDELSQMKSKLKSINHQIAKAHTNQLLINAADLLKGRENLRKVSN